MEKQENRFKLARTTHNQNGKESVKSVSEKTKISKSLIDDLESNVGKKRAVSYLTVKTLAEYYGVTSDYLLGLSDIPSRDEDIQIAAKTTGLSEKSIDVIKLIAIEMGSRREWFDLKSVLDNFINSEHFLQFVLGFWDFQNKSKSFDICLNNFIINFRREIGQNPDKPMECAAKAALGEYDNSILLYQNGKDVLDRREEMQFSYFLLEKRLHAIVEETQKEI